MSGSHGAASLNELYHRRIYELLRDGKWHDLDPIIADVGQLVPPGMAIRRAEESRRGSSQYDSRGLKAEEVGPRKRPRTTEQLIRFGRRAIVYPILSPKHEAGPFERRDLADGRRQVRMVRKSRFIIADELRAEKLRPPFSALAATFAAQGHDYAAEQVQLTAHEYGFHLSSCPADCSLVRLTKARWQDLLGDEDDTLA